VLGIITLRLILDLQVFRTFVQIQGGKKVDRRNTWRIPRVKNYFPTPELGRLTKT
jgi:hypothetical protein